MALVTPNYTDNVSVISAGVLTRGSTSRGTLDLRTKFGAWVFAKMGRGGTTALSGGTTPGVDFLIRRVFNNGGASAGATHPVGVPGFLSSTAAAASTTCATSDSNSGQAVLTVASVTGFAAGDILCIQDSGGGVARLEWARVSKVAGSTLVLDDNLTFTHTAAGADTVRNKADVFAPAWVPGGSLYEVVVDYGDDTAGDSATVQVMAQTYDSETVV